MKKTFVLLALCLGILPLYAQELKMTFRGYGDAATIEWIRATNQNSHVTKLVPGSEPVILRITNPGIMSAESMLAGSFEGMVYPNPFRGNAKVKIVVGEPQDIAVSVVSLSGQEIARVEEFVTGGTHEFEMSVSETGFYMVTLRTKDGISCIKAICSDAEGMNNSLTYRGGNAKSPDDEGFGLKGRDKIKDPLDMREGDVIVYECISGNMTTILTDSPLEPKNYDVQFAECTDPGGKNYPVVQIGESIWMAKNLSYMPEVSSTNEGSFTKPGYYVYGYKGTNLQQAQSTAGYATYGALYNWKAARNICPDGWRLPTDADWQEMEKALGMNSSEVDLSGWRHSGEVGCSLKEEGVEHWNQQTESSVRQTGFNALPGGYAILPMADIIWGRIGSTEDSQGSDFIFQRRGTCTFFWTASEKDMNYGWYRRLGCSENGIERKSGLKSYGYSVRCVRNLQIEDLVSDSGR